VDAPVTQMQAIQSGRETGGTASIIADCTPPAVCPAGASYVLVYVEDNSDSGAGSDVFKIYSCSGFAILPPPTFNGTTTPPGCTPGEGGVLRTGNIQVRADGGFVGEQEGTAAAAGVFPTSATFNGVQLSGGIFGVGIRTGGGTTYGDVHAEFSGISLIGLYQIVTVDGWITSSTVTGGTINFTGTGTLDMGDGPPPTGGLSLVGSMDANGITLTIGGSTLPNLPKTDGYSSVE
jgi:hypothetical protein